MSVSMSASMSVSTSTFVSISHLQHGLTGPKSVFAHCVHMEEAEWDRMKETNSETPPITRSPLPALHTHSLVLVMHRWMQRRISSFMHEWIDMLRAHTHLYVACTHTWVCCARTNIGMLRAHTHPWNIRGTMHTYGQICSFTPASAFAHTHETHTQIHTHTHTNIHTQTHTHAHTLTHTHKHTRTHVPKLQYRACAVDVCVCVCVC